MGLRQVWNVFKTWDKFGASSSIALSCPTLPWSYIKLIYFIFYFPIFNICIIMKIIKYFIKNIII